MRYSMKAFRLLAVTPLALVLAVAAAVAGCDGGSEGQEVVRERDGVQVTLSVNGDSFGPGETVELRVEAENRRDSPLAFGFVPPSEPPLQIRMNSDLGGVQILNADAPALDSQVGTLTPGDSLVAEVDWDQTLALYQDPVQAPEGEYIITARLRVNSSEDDGEVVDVTAAVTVTLTGGAALLPVEDAIQIAFEQPDLRAWVEERDAESAVCLHQPTQVVYSALLTGDSVEETLPELYRVQLENGRPVCSTVSVGGEWRVQFFASGGPEPNRVAVYMDIHTGESVRYEEGGLDPLPSPKD